jgi:hypothetical protein
MEDRGGRLGGSVSRIEPRAGGWRAQTAVRCAWRCLVMALGKAMVVGATISLEKNFPPALEDGGLLGVRRWME